MPHDRIILNIISYFSKIRNDFIVKIMQKFAQTSKISS